MEPIKCRAWDPVTQQMITEKNSGLSSPQIYTRYDNVMLWTTQVDREGNEIYFGDYVQLPDTNPNVLFEVVWERCGYSLKMVNGISYDQDMNKTFFRLPLTEYLLGVQVIGNKYQNSNLIENESDN